MVTRRVDSIQEMNKRKTNEQLAAENAALREQVADLQTQVEEQADALIELAAMVSEDCAMAASSGHAQLNSAQPLDGAAAESVEG